jgi:hypothetical protein
MSFAALNHPVSSQRVNDTLKEEDQDRVGIYGAKLQRKLPLLGVFVSGIASIMAAVALRT